MTLARKNPRRPAAYGPDTHHSGIVMWPRDVLTVYVVGRPRDKHYAIEHTRWATKATTTPRLIGTVDRLIDGIDARIEDSAALRRVLTRMAKKILDDVDDRGGGAQVVEYITPEGRPLGHATDGNLDRFDHPNLSVLEDRRKKS